MERPPLKMHILYLHQHFVARTGTSGGRSHEFSKILVERGHRVTLVTGAYDQSGLTPSKSGWVSRLEVDGIDVLAVNVPYGQKMSMVRRLFSFATFVLAATWAALRIRDVDVVFATSTPLTIAVPGMLAAAWHRRPFVFEVRDLWPEIPIQLGVLRNPILKAMARWLERTAYRRACHIIALSPGMKDGIVAAGTNPDKVSVIPNSSDIELFRVPKSEGHRFREQHPELGDRPLFVYAGAFGRVNGLGYLVRLTSTVAKIDARTAFLLVGQGGEKQHLIKLARSEGVLDSTLFFMDPVPRADLAGVLAAATVLSSFVQPVKILEYNSANKFFDALAAGKPVVINYQGWQADLLNESGAGLVLDPWDVESAAEQLVGAMADREWILRASMASRRLGVEVFNRSRLTDDFEKVLYSACGKG